MFHRLAAAFVAASILAAAPAAAQFVAPGGTLPVVANLPGLNGTLWRSDVSVLNVGDADTQVMFQLFPEIVGGQPAFDGVTVGPILLRAGEQLTRTNVLQSMFQLVNTKGALRVWSTDGAPLVIASRTYNNPGSGTFGQDVSSVLVASRAWAAGLEHDSLYRTNLGIFWQFDEPIAFDIAVYRADGTEVGSGTVSFPGAGLIQVPLSSLGVDPGVQPLLDGFVLVTCPDSLALWYGYVSIVDQVSGDAVLRPLRGFQSDLFGGGGGSGTEPDAG